MRVHIFGFVTLTILISGMMDTAALAGQTTVTGSNGRSATSQSDRQRSENGITTNRTTTYPSGATTQSTGSFTGNGNGSYTGTVDRTNRNGTTNTYQIEGQHSHTNGSYQNNATVTGPNGNLTTVNGSGTYGDGQFNGNRTTTYPGGNTRNTQVQGQRNGQGSYNGTVNTTGRRGNTRSGTFQHNR